MDQIAIALFGVTAIFFSQRESLQMRKWAPVLGMLSQPFWFYATYQAEQWGIFVLCFFYAFAWGSGIYTHWIKHAS